MMIINKPDGPHKKNPQYLQYDDEIDLTQVWSALINGKWLLISITIIFALASIFYALSIPNVYKSTALLVPSESASGGGLAKIAGQFSGFAALAGVDLSGGESNKKDEAIAIMRSWDFIERFIDQNNIAPLVLGLSHWDQESDSLVYDSDVYNNATKEWVRKPPKGKTVIPSSWELYDKFISDNLEVLPVGESGFIELSITHVSPHAAHDWVNSITKRINKELQRRDILAAEKNIEFLEKQIGATSLSSMQTVFYGLIEEQTKNLMLAMSSDEYIFKTLSAARVPEDRFKPQRSLICIVGAVLGFFFGCIVLAFLNFYRNLKSRLGGGGLVSS